MNKRKSLFNSKAGEIVVGVSIAVMQMAVCLTTIAGLIVSSTQSTNNTVSAAQFALFCQDFGEYSDQVIIESMQLKVNNAERGLVINNAQTFYMVSKGFDFKDEHESIKECPEGYLLPKEISEILYPNKNEPQDIVAYKILDVGLNWYNGDTDIKFYGDSNGEENHFITNYGDIFTIPGYSQSQADGSVRFYINANSYYTVSKGEGAIKSPITIEQFEKENKSDEIAAKEFEDMNEFASCVEDMFFELIDNIENVENKFSFREISYEVATGKKVDVNSNLLDGIKQEYILYGEYGKVENLDFYEIIDYSKIANGKFEEKSKHNFYGTINDGEKHYITAGGEAVFAFPGYPIEQKDGSIRYYVKGNLYYVKK